MTNEIAREQLNGRVVIFHGFRFWILDTKTLYIYFVLSRANPTSISRKRMLCKPAGDRTESHSKFIQVAAGWKKVPSRNPRRRSVGTWNKLGP